MTFLTIIITIFSIVFLLALHEFGHFIMAKRFGIRVEEFGIGYPPRLFGKKIGETLYSINLLPFGAFVKIPGLDEATSPEDYKIVLGKPIWQRAAILLGGVVSFWIIAAILLSFVFGIGTPQAISDEENGNLINPKVLVTSVATDSPAEKAGIKPGDVIIKLQGQNEIEATDKVQEVQDFIERNKGQEVILTIERGKQISNLTLVPRISPPEGEGAIGIGLVRTVDKSYSFWQAPIKGIEATANLTVAVVTGWASIISGLIKGQGISKQIQFVGPIGLFSLINQAAQVGLSYFLQFIAMISVYLAVFNILPIPALDGGKLLFLLIEKIKGKPVAPELEQKITTAFFSLLIVLMIWVTIKDIRRLF